jgi:predicted transcriptional regulator
MAEHLGITIEQVHDCYQVLEAHRLILLAARHLTPDQRRVLDALPSTRSGQTISTKELAEKVGMSLDQVKGHLRVLYDLGWMGEE